MSGGGGPELHGVAAMAANRVIGRDGHLPWRLPEDLKFFRLLTTGHPIIMGRRTWESLNGKPLPNRRNIVVSRTLAEAPGAEIIRHPDELAALPGMAETGIAYVIGGAEIYELFLPRCAGFYLTVLDAEWEGDTVLGPVESRFRDMKVLERLPEVAEWRHYKDPMNGEAPSTPPPLPDLRETRRPRSMKPFRERFPRLRASCAAHGMSFDHLALAWCMGLAGWAMLMGFQGALGTSGAEMLFAAFGLSPWIYVAVNQMDAPPRRRCAVMFHFGVGAMFFSFFPGRFIGMIIRGCRVGF